MVKLVSNVILREIDWIYISVQFNKLESVIVDLQMMSSSSSSTQVVSFRDMGMYEPFQQLSGWETPFRSDVINISSIQNNNQSSSTTLEVDARPEADDTNRVRYSLFLIHALD